MLAYNIERNRNKKTITTNFKTIEILFLLKNIMFSETIVEGAEIYPPCYCCHMTRIVPTTPHRKNTWQSLRKNAYVRCSDFNSGKIENFQMNKCDIVLIFAQSIDRGYTLEPPQ